MRKLSCNGFTLLEVLIVLMLLSVVMMISVPVYRSGSDAIELNYFLKELEQDLYYYQMLATTNGRGIRFIFSAERPAYTVLEGVRVLEEREGPEGLRFEVRTLGLSELRFLPGGGVQRSGSIGIVYQESHYRLTFHLIRGRFYFEKM